MPMASATIHGQSLATATVLTSYQVMKPIAPLDVIRVLNREGISFVLVGAYGLAGWTKTPRATQDVDVIVAGRQHKKAVRALLAAFPHLDADDQEVVTRLRDRESGAVTIDVMRPNLLYRAAFKHTVRVEASGQEYRIPS